MKSYLKIVRKIIEEGVLKGDRTGTGTKSYHGVMFEHDMSDGFPILTTKKVPFHLVASELEFFIKGITDKQWLQDRDNHIWDEWCSPDKVPYGHDEGTRKKMADQRCLGPLYGYQWRNFGGSYKPIPHINTNFDKHITVSDKSDDMIGKVINGKYGIYTVIDFDKDNNHNKRYKVKFHKTGYTKDGLYKQSIENGTIFDPYFPNIQNVACLGEYTRYQNGLTDRQVDLLKNSWRSMIQRCYNNNHTSYESYGAKDIYVDDRWLIFENYLNDIQKIDNWDKKLNDWDNYQLDKDLSGKFYYSKDTCIWTTRQNNNNHTSQNYYFDVITPDGHVYENIVGLSKFCNENGLNIKTVLSSIKNNHKTHGGWKFIRKDNITTNNYREGVDQLQNLITTLKTNPDDRRMYVSAWNPMDLGKMALPPCHLSFQVTVSDDKLNLSFYMRSCDVFLGLPFNIASYALLLHLLAKEVGYQEGRLCAFIGDTHIYNNHFDQVNTQLEREPYQLPTIRTRNFTSIFDWEYTDTEVLGYKHHPGIKAPIAV